MLGAKFRAGRHEPLQAGHVDLRGDLDKLDVEHPHPGVGEGSLGVSHHRRLVHQWVAWRGIRDGDHA